MTHEVKDAIKIFTEQACTISMTGERVSVQCDTRGDAEILFAFLESLSDSQQPADWPTTGERIMTLREQIEHAINATSAENGSGTPDFILSEFLTDCLSAFDSAVNMREQWYGRTNSLADPPHEDE